MLSFNVTIISVKYIIFYSNSGLTTKKKTCFLIKPQDVPLDVPSLCEQKNLWQLAWLCTRADNLDVAIILQTHPDLVKSGF